MNCGYCDEPILPGEPSEEIINGKLHIECMVRMTMGSAAHQLRACSCYGGRGRDLPILTFRQSARLAFEVFKLKGGA